MSHRYFSLPVVLSLLLTAQQAGADPCGMVPPIYTGPGQPITRIGDQMTYVFYQDGVETFVIRPGFEGKVDEFGMLIPFPSVPAIRKVPDHVFSHLQAAIDPPEVVVDLRPRPPVPQSAPLSGASPDASAAPSFEFRDRVVVIKQEAVGMYEVAVLEAGSAKALKRWLDEHGYVYPEGMDKPCNDYVESGWCFVAVKTKVGQKDGVDPKPAQRNVNSKLPSGSVFDGNVQGMGFRFESDELVLPMRLSAFNAGELHNIVYIVTDKPQKIRSIPEEYVMRQISGTALHRNVTGPLPLRIIGGTEKDLTEAHKKSLATRRNPEPENGAAKELFAGDLKAVAGGQLSLEHEEKEKELLAIGERLGLRGKEIDKLHAQATGEMSKKATAGALEGLKNLSLTVVDGDFPRDVLANKNLQFAEYQMPARRNGPEVYDAKTKRGSGKKQGVLLIGAVDWSHSENTYENDVDIKSRESGPANAFIVASLGLLLGGLVYSLYRRRDGRSVKRAIWILCFLSFPGVLQGEDKLAEKRVSGMAATVVAEQWIVALLSGQVEKAMTLSDVPFSWDRKMHIKTEEELEALCKKVADEKGARDLKPSTVEVADKAERIKLLESATFDQKPDVIAVVAAFGDEDEVVGILVTKGSDPKVCGFSD